MQIIVNGESKDVEESLSVETFLADLGVDSRKVAVERNLEIVPKTQFGSTVIEEGDKLRKKAETK